MRYLREVGFDQVTKVPTDVVLVGEGEEEIGSPHFPAGRLLATPVPGSPGSEQRPYKMRAGPTHFPIHVR